MTNIYEPEKILKVKESYEIKPRMISNMAYPRDFKPRARIIRHLKDDTFDVVIAKTPAQGNIDGCVPYVMAGERYKTDIPRTTEEIRRLPIKYDEEWNCDVFIVHRKAFGEPLFSELKNLVVGFLKAGRQSLFSIDIDKLPSNELLDVPFGSVGRIDALKAIELKVTRVTTDRTETIHELPVEAIFRKSSLFYEPLQAHRECNTSEVANIYLSSNLYNPERDVKNEMYKIVTGNFEKGLSAHNQLELKQYQEMQIHKRDLLEPRINYYATAVIDQPTYYDYEKNKTINGFNREAQKGDLIPFNFKGDYEFATKLPFWEAFKDFIFRTTYHYDVPFLDKNEGQVILSVENSTEHLIPEMTFTKEAIDDIIKDKSDYSLRALERVSHEKNS